MTVTAWPWTERITDISLIFYVANIGKDFQNAATSNRNPPVDAASIFSYCRYLHIWAWLIMDYIVKIEDNHWKCTLFSWVKH